MKNSKGIIYAVVARNNVVLVEQVNRSPQITHSGNFVQVIHILITKLPRGGNYNYHYDRYCCKQRINFREFDVSVYHREQLTYIALSHRQVPLRTVFVGVFGRRERRASWKTSLLNSLQSTEKQPILHSRFVSRRLLAPSTWWWYSRIEFFPFRTDTTT